MVSIIRIILIFSIVVLFIITFNFMNKNENLLSKELNREKLSNNEKKRAFHLKKYFFLLFCLIVLEFLLETLIK